jgi:outer membrane protein assembly factor BamB
MPKRRRHLIALLILIGALAPWPALGDWPQWRGASFTWESEDVPATLPAKPELLWKRELPGQAYAGIVVAEGKVITANYDRTAKQDVILAYDVKTGRTVWTHAYDNPHDKIEYGPAPRATPLVSGDCVYTIGAAGEVRCLEMATGKLLWRTNFVKDFGATIPQWGFSSTPIVVDAKLIVSPGGKNGSIAALDPKTGKVIWHGKGTGTNYASCIDGTFGGVRQVVGYTKNALQGWAVKDGSLLWSVPVDAKWVGASPVSLGKRLLDATEFSARVFEFATGGKINPEPVAQSEEFTMMEANGPIRLNEVLVATAGGMGLMAVDENLKQLWLNEDKDGFFGFSTIFVGDGRILVFDEAREVHLIAVSAKGCKVLGSARLGEASKKETLAAPALSDGVLYWHDDRAIYAHRVGPPAGNSRAGRKRGEERKAPMTQPGA